MEGGAITDVDRSSAHGTLTDVRLVYTLIRSSAAVLITSLPSLGHCLRLDIRGLECERPFTYEAVSDLLDQRQTEVTELVKTALESLRNSENQQAIDASNHARIQDVAGATVAFEVGLSSISSHHIELLTNATLLRYKYCPRRGVGMYVLPFNRITSNRRGV